MSELYDLTAPRRAYFTADTLVETHFPEPRWAIHGLIGEGLTILAGAPKMGKSWFALWLAVCVASGWLAFGKVTAVAGDVLYLALEDTPRRLKGRLLMLLAGDPSPSRLTIVTEMPEPDNVVGLLDDWLSEHSEARLIVIDVFAKIRNPANGESRSAYAVDYDDAGKLKRLADRHRVAIVLVHHTRKMGADDPFDTISGSTGLTGAADTSLVLKRARNQASASLHVTGRDVSENEYAMTFDGETGRWTLDGRELAEAARKASEMRATEQLDETSRAIVAHVNAQHLGVRAAEVAAVVEGLDAKAAGTYLARLEAGGRIGRLSRGLYGPVESVGSVELGSESHTLNTFHTLCGECGDALTFDDGSGIHVTCGASA